VQHSASLARLILSYHKSLYFTQEEDVYRFIKNKFFSSAHHFLAVEAKKDNMEKGFTQLAVELIAMDHDSDSTDECLYGAITVGDVWRFGMLDRSMQIIYKDIDSFWAPSDMEGLFSVMMGILTGNQG